MKLGILVSRSSSTSSLSHFDSKYDGINQEYYYDPILREYVIRAEIVPFSHLWDLSAKPNLNSECRFGTPATSIIHRQSFESSPLHAPLDAFLLDDPLEFPTNTLDPHYSLDSLYNSYDRREIFGRNSLGYAWEGYQMLLNELRGHQERIHQLRRTYMNFSGDLFHDIPGFRLMEWVMSNFEDNSIRLPDLTTPLEDSLRSSSPLTLLIDKEEPVYDMRKRRIRDRIHYMSRKFLVWIKTRCAH